MTRKTIQIGLVGFGTVGQSVYRNLVDQSKWIAEKTGCEVSVKKVAVSSLEKKRDVPESLLTDNNDDIVTDPDIDVVIEVAGDYPEVKETIAKALKNKKSVITANKALVAKNAHELFSLAEQNGVSLFFEASVAGAVPIIRSLKDGLVANHIEKIWGILNGTSNYILSLMNQEGRLFDDVLKEAQEKGFAEADPSSDVDGYDTAYKLSILMMLAYGKWIQPHDIPCQGIRDVDPIDFEMAASFDADIKLLGVASYDGQKISARVQPVMVSQSFSIAHIHGALNAIQYWGDLSDSGMLSGYGAGGEPTASAVISDLLTWVRNLGVSSQSSIGFPVQSLEQECQIQPVDTWSGEYYLRLTVLDQPSVLSEITKILGNHQISIQHLYQHGQTEENIPIPLIIVTHETNEGQLLKAVQEIQSLDVVKDEIRMIRIEGKL